MISPHFAQTHLLFRGISRNFRVATSSHGSTERRLPRAHPDGSQVSSHESVASNTLLNTFSENAAGCDTHSRSRFAMESSCARSALRQTRRQNVDCDGDLQLLLTVNRHLSPLAVCEYTHENRPRDHDGGPLCNFHDVRASVSSLDCHVMDGTVNVSGMIVVLLSVHLAASRHRHSCPSASRAPRLATWIC